MSPEAITMPRAYNGTQSIRNADIAVARTFATWDNMNTYTAPSRLEPVSHQRGAQKMLSRIRVKIESGQPASPSRSTLRKPPWIRTQISFDPGVLRVKKLLREAGLHSVCEEAQCPNLGECFGKGTATFLIMGDVCTRRCAFCDVAHGRPEALDPGEPVHLAGVINRLGLRYVVVTSVDRDDLHDGGAAHFAACIREIRIANPGIRVEILVPDFRGRMDKALAALREFPCNTFNHNLETVPRLYPDVRPGADYAWSLSLLREHKRCLPGVPTKSGLMLGLGETMDEVVATMRDLFEHGVNMLTIGQYLQPGRGYLPVRRYVHPDEFARLTEIGQGMGFSHVASAPLVRSSYHADRQAEAARPTLSVE